MSSYAFKYLLPDSDVSTGAAWGASPAWSQIADGSTATWATSTVWPDTLIVGLGNFTPLTAGIPAWQSNRIKQIRIRAKVGFNVTSRDLTLVLNSAANGDEPSTSMRIPGLKYVSSTFGTPYREDYVGPWSYRDKTGASWTQASVNNLRMKIVSSFDVNIYDVVVDVAYYWEPFAEITEPNFDGKELTHYPTFRWNFSNGGWYLGSGLIPDLDKVNGTQKKYQVRVYSEHEVSAAALAGAVITDDVTIYPPLVDSGEVSSPRTFHSFNYREGGRLKTPFPGPSNVATPRKVFVRVAKDFNGEDWWGDWVSHTWTNPNETIVNSNGVAATNTNRPVLQWNFSYGKVQLSADIKVYDDLTVTNPDIDEVEPIIEGHIDGPTLNLLSPIALGPQTYRLFVQGQDNQYGESSLWSYSDFTLNYTRPPTPTMTAAPDVGGARVLLTPSWTGNGTFPFAYSTEFQRRAGLNGEWKDIVTSPGTDPIYDEEAELNFEIYYRARVTYGTDFPLYSDWSAAVGTQLTVQTIWIKSLEDPSLNAHFRCADSWLETDVVKRRAIHHPLGRTLPLATKSKGRGESGELLFTVEEDEIEALIDLLDSGDKLLLQMPKRNLYVEVSDPYSMKDHLFDLARGETDIRQISLPFVEVG